MFIFYSNQYNVTKSINQTSNLIRIISILIILSNYSDNLMTEVIKCYKSNVSHAFYNVYRYE